MTQSIASTSRSILNAQSRALLVAAGAQEPCRSSSSSSRALHSSRPAHLQSPPNLTEQGSPSGSLPPLARQHPSLYSAVRPQPRSALAALAARLHLTHPKQSTDEQERRLQLLSQACTHTSFSSVLERAREAQRKVTRQGQAPGIQMEDDPSHNAQLEALGNSLLGLLGSEALLVKYPHLPTRVVKAALSAYVGPSTSAEVANELGLATPGLLRWDRGQGEADQDRMELSYRARAPLKGKGLARPENTPSLKDVKSSAVRALIGLLYQEKGLDAVKKMLHTRFLSRTIDLAGMLKFQDPKRVLSSTCAKYGKERPQSRMIAETGRLSNTPIFVVGVYSGKQKLGEGFGSSIRMAEFRAAEDALRRLYLAQAPLDPDGLPSATLSKSDDEPSFVPGPIGSSEVMHGSRG